ncbi:hypothetical protein CEXT_702051 [Caerostris extrusa]|uniref:Uncharacterized protein n=1 Tax=Caerostris extrusa TaxID=172846 RepID=A0AAV4PFN5_CAEEX|nr:hypothetical protein CEXT_702051 [Caerostris extrusa]
MNNSIILCFNIGGKKNSSESFRLLLHESKLLLHTTGRALKRENQVHYLLRNEIRGGHITWRHAGMKFKKSESIPADMKKNKIIPHPLPSPVTKK